MTKKLSATFDNGPKTDSDSPEVFALISFIAVVVLYPSLPLTVFIVPGVV